MLKALENIYAFPNSHQISIKLICTVEPQLSGSHLSGFSVYQTMEMTALLE